MPGFPAGESARATIFLRFLGEEPILRRKSAEEFPADEWSQDDAFHGHELALARGLANEHKVRLGDVLRALDEGHRAPVGPFNAPHESVLKAMRPGVPPCRPRPIY